MESGKFLRVESGAVSGISVWDTYEEADGFADFDDVYVEIMEASDGFVWKLDNNVATENRVKS